MGASDTKGTFLGVLMYRDPTTSISFCFFFWEGGGGSDFGIAEYGKPPSGFMGLAELLTLNPKPETLNPKLLGRYNPTYTYPRKPSSMVKGGGYRGPEF